MNGRSHVAVVGAGGSLGRRVAALLDADPEVGELTLVEVDLVAQDLGPALVGVDRLVLLSFVADHGIEEDAVARRNAHGASRVLAAASEAGVGHVVVLSDATVYGAWPTSPIPLTEDAPVRPNPEAGYAVQKAEVERLASTLPAGVAVAVLRAAVAVAGGEWSWLARSLNLARGLRARDADPPFQLLHLDDLAEAVVHASRQRLEGVFNVAPDGWMSGEEVRSLAGDPPRIRLPQWLITRNAALAWRWRVGRMPPGLVPFSVHPWVLANDRLKATGWAPGRTNEETYVEATPGTPWSQLSPKRRQELALGTTATVGLGGAAGVVAAFRRRRRRRRSA